jgi:hypothetical protein
LGVFCKKLRPNDLGDIYQKNMRPNAGKMRPNGEISPNLVTLLKRKAGKEESERIYLTS